MTWRVLLIGVWTALLAIGLSGCLGVATVQEAIAPTVRSVAVITPSVSAPNQPAPSATRPLLPTPTRTATPSPMPIHTPIPSPTAPPTRRAPFVAVDAGHGGIDLGARHFDDQGHMDFHESEVNLDLALRVRDLLQARGYRVFMTRDGDYLLNDFKQDVNGNGEIDFVDEAQERVDRLNEAGVELLLSIHQNGYEGRNAEKVGGVSTFYCADRPFSERNQRFAELVHAQLLAAHQSLGHDPQDRGVLDDRVLQKRGEPGEHLVLLGPEHERIVRPCLAPGALSEPLFVTHRKEAQLARDPAALDRLALAYADAIDQYFAEIDATPEAGKTP